MKNEDRILQFQSSSVLSLSSAIQDAGGSVLTWDVLKNMSVSELFIMLSKNNVLATFEYKFDKKKENTK